MNTARNDRLESIAFQPSTTTELSLIKLGVLFADSLRKASTANEVVILVDIIGEYSTMVSYYGEATGRIPESLGVDINEAALLKHESVTFDRKTEWEIFLQQFENDLDIVKAELNLTA